MFAESERVTEPGSREGGWRAPTPVAVRWGYWMVNGIFTGLDMECDVVAKGLTAKSERCTVTAAFKPYEVVCLPVASPACGGSARTAGSSSR